MTMEDIGEIEFFQPSASQVIRTHGHQQEKLIFDFFSHSNNSRMNSALLTQINSGARLKKVPDAQKNDRSGAAAGAVVGKTKLKLFYA